MCCDRAFFFFFFFWCLLLDSELLVFKLIMWIVFDLLVALLGTRYMEDGGGRGDRGGGIG